MIDAYITELGNALRGPMRAKHDLLTEARDSLIDAAEAYEAGGTDRAAAERQAVRDFGTVPGIAAGYQTELGLSQGRRTALLILFVFAAQPFIWGYAFRWATNKSNADSPTGFRVADEFVENLGGVTLLGSMVALLGYWLGMRYPAVRARITRVTGVFGLVVAGSFVAFSLFLAFFSAKPDTQLLVISLAWTVAFIMIPMSVIAVSARRCLVTGPAHH